MPFETKYFSLAQPPQCAGIWVLNVLERGITVPPRGPSPLSRHAGAHIHEPGRVRDLPSVTLVRDPTDWLMSMYQNRIGPVRVEEIDRLLTLKGTFADYLQARQSVTFVEFVEKYLKQMPGQITRIFELYESDYTVDLADLPDGFVNVMDALDVEYDPIILKHTPPQQVTETKLMWPDGLRERVVEAEGYKKPRKKRRKKAVA